MRQDFDVSEFDDDAITEVYEFDEELPTIVDDLAPLPAAELARRFPLESLRAAAA